MQTDNDKFFILTNPIFWVYFLIMASYYLLDMLNNFLGIKDWYWVLFKLKNMPLAQKKDLVKLQTSRKTKFFWLKEKAWERAKNIIEKEVAA